MPVSLSPLTANIGTFGSTVTGTTLTTNGVTWGPSHLGKAIAITFSTGIGQIREITAVGTNSVTIEHPFNVSAFRSYTKGNGSQFTETTPTPGTSFVVSETLDDIIARGGTAATTVIKLANTPNSFRFASEVTLNSGFFLYDKNVNIEMNFATTFTPTSGSYTRFGRVVAGDISDANGIPYYQDQVNITATDVGPPPGDTNVKGNFELYGNMIVTAGVGERLFLRYYRGNDHIVRFAGGQIDGSFGGRIRGNDSLILDMKFRGGANNLGKFNVTSQDSSYFGLVQNVDIRNTDQALYHFWEEGGSSTVRGVSFGDILDTGQVLYINGLLNGQFDFKMTDIDYTQLSTFSRLIDAAATTSTNRVSFANFLTLSAINADLSTVSSNLKYAQENSQNTQLPTEVTTTGSFAERELALSHMFIVKPGINRIYSISDDVTAANTFFPYTYALYSRTLNPFIQTTQMDTSENVAATLTPDLRITESNQAVVDAYTTVETAEKFYDYGTKLKYDSPYIPSIDTQWCDYAGGTITLSDYSLIFTTGALSALAFASTNVIANLLTEFTGNIIMNTSSAPKTVTFNNTIVGGVQASSTNNTLTIGHSFSTGDTIINTSEAVGGTITLNSGSYNILNADLTNLTINRAAGQTGPVNLIITGASGLTGLSIGAGVVSVRTLSLDVRNTETDGLLSVHRRRDGHVDVVEYVTGATLMGLTDNLYVINTLIDDETIAVVYTEPGRTDFRASFTVIASTATSTVIITNESDTYPVGSGTDYTTFLDGDPVSTIVAIGDTDAFLTVKVLGSLTVELANSPASFNTFLQESLRGTNAYNYFISLINRDFTIFESPGGVGSARTFSKYLRFTSDTINQNLPYADNTGTENRAPSETLTLQDGSTITNQIQFAASPPEFDGGLIEALIVGQTVQISAKSDVVENMVAYQNSDGDNTSPALRKNQLIPKRNDFQASTNYPRG